MYKTKAITTIIFAGLLHLSATMTVAQEFAGPYAGLGVSYSSGDTDAHWLNRFSNTGDDSHDLSGVSIGGFVGHNWQNGRSVFGLEAGFDLADIGGDDNFNSGIENGTRISGIGHVSGRVGRASDIGLFYASLGLAIADVKATERDIVGGPLAATNDISHVGARLGLGAEIPFRSGRVRLEVSHVRFDREDSYYPTYSIDSRPVLNQAGIYYVFGF